MPPAELQTFARTVDELLADRSKRLVDYQNQAYADRYAALVEKARTAEATTAKGMTGRSEEHTSELQSLMRISYAVFCLKNKNYIIAITNYSTIRESDN